MRTSPIASMLAHMSLSLSGCRLTWRAIGQSGVAMREAISHSAVAPNATRAGQHVGQKPPSDVGMEQEDDERRSFRNM